MSDLLDLSLFTYAEILKNFRTVIWFIVFSNFYIIINVIRSFISEKKREKRIFLSIRMNSLMKMKHRILISIENFVKNYDKFFSWNEGWKLHEELVRRRGFAKFRNSWYYLVFWFIVSYTGKTDDQSKLMFFCVLSGCLGYLKYYSRSAKLVSKRFS